MDKEFHVCTQGTCDPVLDLPGESRLNSYPRQTSEVTFGSYFETADFIKFRNIQ